VVFVLSGEWGAFTTPPSIPIHAHVHANARTHARTRSRAYCTLTPVPDPGVDESARRLLVLGGIHEGRATLELEIVEIKGTWWCVPVTCWRVA
jgi:hypothetical protein